MVSRVLEQQQAICAVLAEDHKNWHKMPTDSKFSTLEAIVKVFKPPSYLTDALSGEQCVTASAVRPLLDHMYKEILCESPDDCTISKEMKSLMMADLKTRYPAV